VVALLCNLNFPFSVATHKTLSCGMNSFFSVEELEARFGDLCFEKLF
jgi:hypothetical protein